MSKVRVLEPDDERFTRLAQHLTVKGYTVSRDGGPFGSGGEGDKAVVAAISGLNEDPAAFCAHWRKQSPDSALVLVGSGNDFTEAIRALRAGPDDYVPNGDDLPAIVSAVERGIAQRALRWQLKNLTTATQAPGEPFSEIRGSSQAIVTLREQLARLRSSDASILIVGESGTGKEIVARALHRHGPRSKGPFVAVNCAAMPPHLLESEFFGHAKGAFTGAEAASRGLFVAATGGTLVLDEIGAMPVGLQAKLLRALQDRTVRPVGETRSVPVDVRVIAATNVDLEQEVTKGRFREDLYYRLNVIELRIPPLRERGDDVLELSQVFLERAARAASKPVVGITPAAARLLLGHTWPGNVRELENCIEAAVAVTRFDHITDADLPESVQAVPKGDLDEPRALEEIERSHIARVLRLVEGNKTEAARLLGITRKTLYRKLERYRLDRGPTTVPPGHDSDPASP